MWTAERIRAYGVRMPAVDALDAVLGYQATKAYQLLASGEPLPFPVIRHGRRYITPTASVLALLAPETSVPGPTSPGTATHEVADQTGDPDERIVRRPLRSVS